MSKFFGHEELYRASIEKEFYKTSGIWSGAKDIAVGIKDIAKGAVKSTWEHRKKRKALQKEVQEFASKAHHDRAAKDPSYAKMHRVLTAGKFLGIGGAAAYGVHKLKLRQRQGTEPGQENYPTYYV